MPEGVEVKVDSNILNEELIRLNPLENMKMVRLSSENIDSAKLILPSNILDGTNNLNLLLELGLWTELLLMEQIVVLYIQGLNSLI